MSDIDDLLLREFDEPCKRCDRMNCMEYPDCDYPGKHEPYPGDPIDYPDEDEFYEPREIPFVDPRVEE